MIGEKHSAFDSWLCEEGFQEEGAVVSIYKKKVVLHQVH